MGRKKSGDVKVDSPFLDVAEAAMYMKVAKGTLYNMMNDEDLNLPVRRIGRKCLFLLDELKEWINKNTSRF